MKTILIQHALAAMLLCSSVAQSATLTHSSVPNGYEASSLELGAPFAGAIACDPANSRLYVSVGGFGTQSVLLVDTVALTTSTVTPVLGVIGGIAVLPDGSLAITENFTSNTIFRARDLTADQDFLDAGEITELIAPILDEGNFSGAQAGIAPAGAAGIPAGSLLVQTADGNTSSELMVIRDPTTTPAYRPTGGSYFSGFQFNGGFGFTSNGNLIMGESKYNFLTFTSTGRIYGLANSNSNETIDGGESHVLVDEPLLGLGLTDLAVSAEDLVLFGENSGTIGAFTAPANVLSGSPIPQDFAETNSVYISALEFDNPALTFAAGTETGGARLYVGGLVGFYEQATNLLVIEPRGFAASADWELYQ